MAAASGAAGGSTSNTPPNPHTSSLNIRSDGPPLAGNADNHSRLVLPSQTTADLLGKTAQVDSSSLKEAVSAPGERSFNSQQGVTPNPNTLEVQPSLNNPNKQPSYAKTVISGVTKRPPPAFVTNLTVFHPVKRGNASFLKMPEDLYQRRLSAFTYALIGRIFLPKQSPPRPLADLKSELQTLFKTEQDWSLTPLGKGFFSLKFSTQDDHVRASRYTSWKLKLGSFFLREWKPNFDPYKEQTSISQLWVRLFHLPEEYWDLNFLVGIFRAVGNVVKLDGSTAAGTVGHFARALVEVDMSYPLTESVTIEGCSSNFVVEFGFENLPLYCSYCRYIGHSIVDCKSKKKTEDSAMPKDKSPATDIRPDATKTNAKPRTREWQLAKNPPARPEETAPKQKSVPVSTSNAFAALENDSSTDPPVAADANTVRELVPLSAAAAAALHSIAGRDYTLHNPETENVLSSDDEEEEEIQADTPPMAAAGSQADNTSSEPPFNAGGPELSPKESAPETENVDDEEEEEIQADNPPMAAAGSQADNTSSEPPFNAGEPESSPKGSAMPSKTTPTDKDETTTVVPSPGQVAGHKMSAAAKRRTKEALRKGRVRSSMKTRSSFDTSSDTLHVLADRRGKSVQAASVGQPHGPKQSQLEDKLRTAVEQGKRPTAYVLDTGQSGALKAMELIAKQKWGDVLDLAAADNDIYDLTS